MRLERDPGNHRDTTLHLSILRTKQAQTAQGNVRISQFKISQFTKIIITEYEELCQETGKTGEFGIYPATRQDPLYHKTLRPCEYMTHQQVGCF